MNKHKNNVIIISLISALFLYYLAGIWINPLIFWTALPLYISYILMRSATREKNLKKVVASYGYILISVTLSILYHLTWFFDWHGTQSSSSTSSLIFVVFPVYAAILGLVGYASGYAAGFLFDRK